MAAHPPAVLPGVMHLPAGSRLVRADSFHDYYRAPDGTEYRIPR